MRKVKVMYLFSRVMCGICLICSVGFLISYILDDVILKLFLGCSFIATGVAYAMIDPDA